MGSVEVFCFLFVVFLSLWLELVTAVSSSVRVGLYTLGVDDNLCVSSQNSPRFSRPLAVCGEVLLSGESCSSNAECFSGVCSSGSTCTGIPTGSRCSVELHHGASSSSIRSRPCLRGAFCRRDNVQTSSGTCMPVLKGIGSCDIFAVMDGGCPADCSCDLDFSGQGSCKRLFSGQVGSECHSNVVCAPHLGCLDGKCVNSKGMACNSSDQCSSLAPQGCVRDEAGNKKCPLMEEFGSGMNGECQEQIKEWRRCQLENECVFGLGGSPLKEGTCQQKCSGQIKELSCCLFASKDESKKPTGVLFKCTPKPPNAPFVASVAFAFFIILSTALSCL